VCCYLVTYLTYVLGKAEFSFSDVLLQSLCPEQVTPAWCDCCEKYQPTVQSRQLKVLPKVLAMNCGLDNQQVGIFIFKYIT